MGKLKENKTLLGVGIILLLLGVMGMSYAWFSATVTPKNVKDQVVSTGTLELTYTDGTEIKLVNARPGATATKKITVKNTGTLDTSYNLVWQVLKNEITNNEMVMSATCQRLKPNGEVEENCEGLDETPITGNMVLKGVDIPSGYSHEYTVTVTFKELSKDQNYNQGKSFTGVLGVDEYKEATPKYCTFDGDMTQGAEYTDGIYTYRYMQEGSVTLIQSSNESNRPVVQNSNIQDYEARNLATTNSWSNITDDGWGVQLTDKDSTAPITEAPCAYINNKPVVSMAGLFAESKATSIDMSNFYTSKVTSMWAMFFKNETKTLDLSSLDTSEVTNMNYMFNNSKATNINLKNVSTENVIGMQAMFVSTSVSTLDLTSFNTNKVTDTSDMFYGSSFETLDISSFDTSNVVSMNSMFSSCSNLKTIFASNKFVTTAITSEYGGSSMFDNSPNLVGGNGTTYDSTKVDKTYARIDTADAPGYFTAK